MKKARIPALILFFAILLAYVMLPGGSPRRSFASWTLDCDFSLTSCGFVPYAPFGSFATYTGARWESLPCHDPPCTGGIDNPHLEMSIDFAETVHLTGIEIWYVRGTAECGSLSQIYNESGGGIGAGLNGAAGSYHDTDSVSADLSGVIVALSSGTCGTTINYITHIIFSGTTGDPSTPTPTGTVTPTLPPNNGGGAFVGRCFLLGDASATFQNLPGLWTLSDETNLKNPDGTTQGLELPFGQADQHIYLDPSQQYALTVNFHVTDPQDDQSFFVGLGSTPFLNVAISNTSNQQTYESDFAQWSPDVGGGNNQYSLTIGAPLNLPDPGLVIDYFCVTPNQQTSGSTPPLVTEDCSECIYAPKGGFENLGDDIIKIIAWLWCGIRRVIVCFLASMINGIWQVVVNIIAFLAFVRLWVSQVIERAVSWALTTARTLWNWLGGTITNVIRTVLNIGAQVFNSLNIGGIINGVLSFLRDLFLAIADIVVRAIQAIPALIGIIGAIFLIVLFWLAGIVQAVAQIIVAIPVFILNIISGFNTPATTIPVYAPSCSSSNTLLFWPCVGGYIIDNTILDGPLYLIIIAVWGVVALMVILWALRHIQETLSQ